jgi:hypothetical protein
MKWSIICLALMFSLGFTYCHSKTGGEKESKVVQSNDTGNDKDAASFTYDLSKPVQSWDLPESLKEVSGNAWVDGNHLLIIEDLHPILYLVRLDKGKGVVEKQVPFAPVGDKKFDIEDVAVAGTAAYALWSHGVIYKIENWQTDPKVTELSTGLDKKNNTEGLCLDPVSGNLLVACKNESGLEDEKASDRAIYMFDTQKEKLKKDPFLIIEKKEFKKLGGEKIDFFPSAVAVHPVTHEVYVLSTKENKCMVQYSYEGKIRQFQMINKDLMPQPEGLCFSPDGRSLFISTEGRHGGPPKVYEFTSTAK